LWILLDGSLDVEWVDHHVPVAVVGQCREDPPANSKRRIAPMLQLNNVWQGQCKPAEISSGDC
jgi:hypothetical protein